MTSVHTLVDRDEYNIRGEFLWFGVILHSDVHVWTPAALRRFRIDLRQVTASISSPCWAFQTPGHDPKKRKFIKAVGGVMHHYRITPDGERAEMYLFPPLNWNKGS